MLIVCQVCVHSMTHIKGKFSSLKDFTVVAEGMLCELGYEEVMVVKPSQILAFLWTARVPRLRVTLRLEQDRDHEEVETEQSQQDCSFCRAVTQLVPLLK